MNKHLKKIAVFAVNAAVVLFGAILIKNHEKNKLAAEADEFSDSQIQTPDFEASLSTPEEAAPEALQEEPAAIPDDAANQPAPPAVNVPSNAAPKVAPPPAKAASSTPTKSSKSSSKKSSTPKTKTS